MKIEYLYLPFEYKVRDYYEKEIRIIIIDDIIEGVDHPYFDWLIGKPKSKAENWKPKSEENDKRWDENQKKIIIAKKDYKRFVLQKEKEKKWREEKWHGFEVRDFDNI